MCITKELFDDVLGGLGVELENERKRRQKISDLIKEDMNVDKFDMYTPSMALARGLMLRCCVKEEVDEDKEIEKRFYTLRMIPKSGLPDEDLKSIDEEQVIIANLSTHSIVSTW